MYHFARIANWNFNPSITISLNKIVIKTIFNIQISILHIFSIIAKRKKRITKPITFDVIFPFVPVSNTRKTGKKLRNIFNSPEQLTREKEIHRERERSQSWIQTAVALISGVFPNPLLGGLIKREGERQTKRTKSAFLHPREISLRKLRWYFSPRDSSSRHALHGFHLRSPNRFPIRTPVRTCTVPPIPIPPPPFISKYLARRH